MQQPVHAQLPAALVVSLWQDLALHDVQPMRPLVPLIVPVSATQIRAFSPAQLTALLTSLAAVRLLPCARWRTCVGRAITPCIGTESAARLASLWTAVATLGGRVPLSLVGAMCARTLALRDTLDVKQAAEVLRALAVCAVSKEGRGDQGRSKPRKTKDTPPGDATKQDAFARTLSECGEGVLSALVQRHAIGEMGARAAAQLHLYLLWQELKENGGTVVDVPSADRALLRDTFLRAGRDVSRDNEMTRFQKEMEGVLVVMQYADLVREFTVDTSG